MAGLPFQPEIFGGNFVEHHFPCVGIVGDVPVAALPIAVHRAIFEGDANPVVLGPLGERRPDFAEALKTVLDRLAPHPPGESGDRCSLRTGARCRSAPPSRRAIDGRFRRFSIGLPNIAKLDRDIGVADGVADFAS